jgi:hypothetical protein
MTSGLPIYPADNDNLKVPIKPSSQSWVKLALDPFHDYPVDFAGMPDAHGDQTSIRSYQFIQSVTVPDDVVAGEKWDCSIIAMPLLGPTFLRRSTMQSPGNFTTSLVQFPANTVVIAPRASNIGIYSNNDFTANAYSSLGPTDLDDQVPCRIVAGGFEVHNTTPSLHAGGSVMVRSTGSSRSIVQLWDATDLSSTVANIIKGPVNFPRRAAADPQARIWSAKEGCYVPFRLTLDNTDFHYPSANTKVIYTGFGASENDAWTTDSDFNANFTSFNKYPVREGNIEVSSAHFTGLPYETTLEVTVKVIVEFSPTTKLSELALTTPACPYDPKALTEYRNAISDLPPGVKVNMNAKGDWWKMIKKAVQYATPLASTILGPEGAVLAKGLNTLVDVVDKPLTAHYTKVNSSPRKQTRHQGTINRQTVPASGRNAARNDEARLKNQPKKKKKMVYGYYDSEGTFHQVH